MIWRKKSDIFLKNPPGTVISRHSVTPEALPLLVLQRQFHGEGTLVLTLPDAPAVEKLVSGLQELLALLGMEKKILAVPECGRGKLLFPGGEARRARALNRISGEKFDIICGSVHALLGAAPPPRESIAAQLELRCGMVLPIDELLARLVKLDYDDEVSVVVSGEFSRRGGIVDIFSPAHDEPCRIEFFGDEIDSMRFFSPETQRSTGRAESYRIINRAGITAGGAADSDVFAYLEYAGKFRLLDIWPDAGEEKLANYSVPGAVARWEEMRQKYGCGSFFDSPAAAGASVLPAAEVEPFFPAGSHGVLDGAAGEKSRALHLALLQKLLNTLDGDGAVLMLAPAPEDVPLLKRWTEKNLTFPCEADFAVSALASGFVLPQAKLMVITAAELAPAGFARPAEAEESEDAGGSEEPLPELAASAVPELDISDFDEGDYVVHLDYGIALYRGLRKQRSNGECREVLVLEFRDSQQLFVPLSQADKVSRYLGAPGRVKLHALGGNKWNSDKENVRQGVRSYAADMLRFQAVRQSVPGISFQVSGKRFATFLRSFPFRDTSCQLRATREIARDMSEAKPMDRLLCGDVGFGKTEIAIRSAFRAVSCGYQVAVIAPTTVLAQQHFRSFQERFAEYPFVIDTVSRFRSNAEQREIAKRLASGGIDILIGTHRLCGSAFKFRNLGLVIIDEEQRFGVDQKERLRRFRVEADVLSMSATPIPRTLYLAMAGARDLSTLLTPPKLRLPVKTVIAPIDKELVATAIRSELARGGQVYYLHNRVATIEGCARKLREMLPNSRIAVGHGQMPEEHLAEVMEDFINGKIDVLVCSTIIESGLDVPNANTIIIERADRFGLAELYQLRGRVGRWKEQAYAYMLLPGDQLVGSTARKRLAAIRRCSTMGAGFQLALRDLEIRGAGNLLGSEQSGHLNMIGFDLYCKLLKQEVARLKGSAAEALEMPEIAIDFVHFALEAPAGVLCAAFPESFIENERMRIAAYRKLANFTTAGELKDYADELRDIYGKLPPEAEVLLEVAALRIAVARCGYRLLKVVNGEVSISNPGGVVYRAQGKLPRLDCRNQPRMRLRQLAALIAKMPVRFPEKS